MSATLNVMRWSALGAGIVYGFVHRLNRQSAVEAAHKAEEWKKQEELIAKAKAEYAKLHPKKEEPTGTLNLDDPNFDIAKYIETALN